MTSTSDPSIESLHLPSPVTATDRLRLLYDHPGPYVSLYLELQPDLPDGDNGTLRRWTAHREKLAGEGASEQVLSAIDARLFLPPPEDAGAIAILAASDATTIVDYGQEPPRTDLATFGTLPYSAPLLEWEQRRVPHLVVTVDAKGADIVTFGQDNFTRLDSVDGNAIVLTETIASIAATTRARLVLVAGLPHVTRRLSSDLVGTLPVDCRVVAEPDLTGVDELADAAVRHVTDSAARETVGYLRELRFLAAHQSAVDGVADTIDALRNHGADVLLVHDSPEDDRHVWVGSGPDEISLEPRAGYQQARLVDAVIRTALMGETDVHVIPTTGPSGPDDNTAAIYR